MFGLFIFDPIEIVVYTYTRECCLVLALADILQLLR